MQSKILFSKTSWIKNLGLNASFNFLIFFFSLILLIINFLYPSFSDFMLLDSISFPIQILLNVYIFFVSFYFFINCLNWFYISKQASGSRRIINFLFTSIFLISTLVIFSDSIYKFTLLFKSIGPFLSATSSTLLKPVFMGWFIIDSNSVGFNVILIMIFSFFSFALCVSFYYFQKIKYKSEESENKSEKTIDGYINNFVKTRKRKLKKVKTNDLSKKITSF